MDRPFCPALHPLLPSIRQEHQSQARTARNCLGRTHSAKHRVEIESIVDAHFGIVRRKAVGQIQNGTRVAAVHQHGTVDTCSHGLDQHLENIIINNLSRRLEIHRNQRFIVAIIFITRIVTHSTTMTAVMHKDNITGLTVFGNATKGVFNVALGRSVVPTIVHENEHFGFAKALSIDQKAFDIVQVIVAACLRERISVSQTIDMP